LAPFFVCFSHDTCWEKYHGKNGKKIKNTMVLHTMLLLSSESSQRGVGGASTWFETVWSYDVEAIDY
jgi:hypothetical protein